MIKSIRDYYPIHNLLATSGQPTPEQFVSISQAGYRVVINLATSISTNALPNEGVIVTDLGMVYVQIPVVWTNPKLEDVEMFFMMMHSFKEQKVWIHCAKNMRVSCFIYFWQKYVLQLPDEQARYPMNQIWQPTGVWQQLIEKGSTALAHYHCS